MSFSPPKVLKGTSHAYIRPLRGSLVVIGFRPVFSQQPCDRFAIRMSIPRYLVQQQHRGFSPFHRVC